MDKTKIIKAEITIPTAPYANIKPEIGIEVPEHLSGVALAQYLWDTFNGLFEKELKKELKMIVRCDACGNQLKNIPAGISKKTKKPYEAFAVCPNSCSPNRDHNPGDAVAGMSEEDEKIMRERAEGGNTKIDNPNEVF